MALAEINYNDVKARMVRAVEQEASQSGRAAKRGSDPNCQEAALSAL